MCLKLNEYHVTKTVFESIPADEAEVIITEMAPSFLLQYLTFISIYMAEDGNRHVQFVNSIIKSVLFRHGHYLSENSVQFAPIFRSLKKKML